MQTTGCIWQYYAPNGGSSACPCAGSRRLVSGVFWSLDPAQHLSTLCSYKSDELLEASELEMLPLRETCLRIELRGCAERGLFVVVYSPEYRLSTTTRQRENRFAGRNETLAVLSPIQFCSSCCSALRTPGGSFIAPNAMRKAL